MSFDPTYTLLRNFTSPVAAITTSAGGRRNGFIVNSAQRASLVPTMPRLSIYVSKTNFSHDLIYKSGVFALHLLRTDQFETIFTLGFQSGREVANKLDLLQTVDGTTGCPLLKDCIAGFECNVVNAMDTGASTFFLGDVVNVLEGKNGPVMTSEYFRDHLSAEKKWEYENNLRAAAGQLEELAKNVNRESVWPGPVLAP
ncbi:MAG TPA: flavin reductase family protein [Longimicrobiales bacterium]|nr:flavin reductase family protein [Longimicrobiales bacterium]